MCHRWFVLVSMLFACFGASGGALAESLESVPLPAPSVDGHRSLEQLLARRRSVREFSDESLSAAEVGQLLWAAQGISDPEGLRTAPSAGALYPLEVYLIAGAINGLPSGQYHYKPVGHRLVKIASGDRREVLARAAFGQSWLADAAAIIAFTGMPERTRRKYGARAERYVHIEIGHAAENLFLQAEALDLGTVVVGAFDDEQVTQVLQLPAATRPYLLMPVGRSAAP